MRIIVIGAGTVGTWVADLLCQGGHRVTVIDSDPDKILGLEVERSFHPTVVRPIKLGGASIEDAELRKSILVYFGLLVSIFVFSWIFIVTVEPDSTWGNRPDHKLIDSASSVAATLNNVGPGLGTVGATQNFAHFSPPSKLLFVWLMMLGRVEIFVILVLFLPSFWRVR